MKLTAVQVSNYKCIRDPVAFDISDITCLVGMNESGKTAILEALYRLNPIIPETALSTWTTTTRESTLKITGST